MTTPLKTYEIKIYKAGIHVDTQTVEAEDEGRAISAAMIKTRVVFAGAAATYEGRVKDSGETFRPFVRDI